MTFRTSTRGGKSTKTITVTTDDPAEPSVKLTLTADVHVALALEPYLINFGRLKRGEQTIRYVALTGDAKDSAKILSVECKNKDFAVETSPSGYENDKDKKIKITVLPTMKAGQFREQLTVTTDHKEIKTMSINLFGEILGDIIVTPRSFSFGFFEKGKSPEKIIDLKANQNASFKVLKAEATTPDVKTEIVTLQEGKEYQIKAKVKDGFDKDSINGKLIITTDNVSQPTVEVMFFGRLQKGPRPEPFKFKPPLPPKPVAPPLPPPQ